MRTFFYSLLAAVFGALFGYATRPIPDHSPLEKRTSTLRSIVGSPDPTLANKLDAMSAAQLLEMLEQGDELPELAVCAILSRWAKLDPTAAAEHVTENHFPTRTRVIALTSLAEHDIEAALVYLGDSPESDVSQAILAVLAENDPQRAVGFTASPSGDLFPSDISENFWELTAQRLSKSDPDKLAKLIASVEPSQSLQLLRAWQEIDPERALAVARQLLADPRFATDPGLLSLAPGLAAELNPEQLEALAQAFESHQPSSEMSLAHHQRLESEFDDLHENNAFTESYAEAWARENPEAGLDWIAKLTSRKSWNRMRFMSEWNERDPEAAENYLRQLPASEELYHAAFDSWITNEEAYVHRALEWYDAQSDEMKLEIARTFPESCIVHDPGSVLKWAVDKTQKTPEKAEPSATIFEDTAYGIQHYIDRSLDTWLRRDEAAARQWLFEVADPALSDKLLSNLGYFHTDYFPPLPPDILINDRRYSVYEVQSLISDPELRMKTLRKTMSFEHSSSAQKHLDASSLPDAIRADLQEFIDSGKTYDALYSD